MDVMERHRLGRLDEEALQDRDVRNPLKQIEVRGGGLFELEWYERARLLRQLVDWQCGFYKMKIETMADIQ
jgi:hypothetical protein